MNIHHSKRPAQEKTQLVMVHRSVCHVVCMNDMMKMFKRKKERKKMYE